jgi:hypothetical protein
MEQPVGTDHTILDAFYKIAVQATPKYELLELAGVEQ